MKKIIAFAGSNSSVSINRILVEYTLEYFQDFEVQLLDLNDYEMPIYSLDRERKDGVPQMAYDIRKKLHDADAFVVSVAEHNWNITAVLKNLLDWCSRVDMNIFNKKPMLLMSTSISRAGAARAMEYMLKCKDKFNMNVVETFSLPSFNHTFAENKIVDKELKKLHKDAVERLLTSLQE